jgi:hypothetical protein
MIVKLLCQKKGGKMQKILTSAEAMVAVYEYAEKQNCKASGPITYTIHGRKDALACWAIVEGEKQPVIATLFVVGKDGDSNVRVKELIRWRGVRFLKAFEREGYFIFKIAGPGLQCRELKVSISDVGLKPQQKKPLLS